MNTYRKKNYRGKRSYGGRPHRRPADSYHQPIPADLSRIPCSRHTLTKPDVEAVVDALLSGSLCGGRELERFESLLAKLTHSEYAIAVSSGTAAIHSALACLKLEPEDEIITSTLNFCGVANMICLTGATPVLVDCDPNTLTLSIEAARRAITDNTKAIFTNNFGGHPSDLQGLRTLCDDHNLLLLEDAAHGLGGKYRGHYVGNQADLTCFSFHHSMAITTCEGGAVTTNNRAIAEWLRQFRNHGIQKDARFFQSDKPQPAYFQEIQLRGMNYHLSEIHAALGRSQLTRLDRHIERRRSIAQVYFQKLGTVEEMILPYVADWADNAYHFYPVQFTDGLASKRDDIFNDMVAAGIDVQVHYVPIHRMPALAGLAGDASRYPNAETYFSRCLSLPLYPDLSFKDIDRITDILLKSIGKYLQSPQAVVALQAETEDGEPEAAKAPVAKEPAPPLTDDHRAGRRPAVKPGIVEELPEAPAETSPPVEMPGDSLHKGDAKAKTSRLRKVPKDEDAPEQAAAADMSEARKAPAKHTRRRGPNKPKATEKDAAAVDEKPKSRRPRTRKPAKPKDSDASKGED